MAGRLNLTNYGKALAATAVALLVVGQLQASLLNLPTAILLYLVPVILAASRWGRGPAILAVLLAVLGHDVLFVDPIGRLTIARPEEAIGLALLLFTAMVTAQLADSARRGALAAQEAALARRSDELKTALLRTVSHDLRTPLASIKANVSSLRQPDAAFSPEDRAELLAGIEEEADRLDRLVRNLLDASRIEAGALRPRREPQDLAELVLAVVRRLQPLLDGRKVELDLPDDLPLVACDYAQVEQVVANLLENAAVHTRPPGAIRVRARAQDGTVRAEVLDEGPGILPGDRERLFRPFERGRAGGPGSGLGLAIARGLTEANGGRLWIEDAPGGGAGFVFSLPVWSAAR